LDRRIDGKAKEGQDSTAAQAVPVQEEEGEKAEKAALVLGRGHYDEVGGRSVKNGGQTIIGNKKVSRLTLALPIDDSTRMASAHRDRYRELRANGDLPEVDISHRETLMRQEGVTNKRRLWSRSR